MYVKLWTGTRIPVVDRGDAVRVIKLHLKDWMNPDDHIGWYNSDEDDKLGRKPSHALVMTEYGEATDAEAWIIHKDLPAPVAGENRVTPSPDRMEAFVEGLRAKRRKAQKKRGGKPRLSR